MTRRSTVVLGACAAAAAAAVAVPLLTAGSEKPRLTKLDYSRRVTAIFAAVGEGFRLAGAGGDPTQTSASLRSMTADLDRAAARLGVLRPPRDAERDQRVLVDSTRDYATQVDLVRASVDFGDPVNLATHLAAVTAPAAINRAIRDLDAKGYRIPVRVGGVR